jgi:hypothetical protein
VPYEDKRLRTTGSVSQRLLCIPVQSTSEGKTRGEERRHCPPRGAADAHNAPSIPWQDALPYAFEAGLESNLFVTLPKEYVGRGKIEVIEEFIEKARQEMNIDLLMRSTTLGSEEYQAIDDYINQLSLSRFLSGMMRL